MKKTYPSDEQDRFLVRMPQGMRQRIAETAKANGRSMNAEIVARLEATFVGEGSEADMMKRREELRKLVRDEISEFMRHESHRQDPK